MRNHTTTHLLNWALRRVLGDHVEQKGSLVDAEHLRFDFTHTQAMTHEQLAQVERLVNEKIYSDLPVKAEVMPLAEAKKLAGVRAVFGEKYPDPVRVIAIGIDDPKHASAEHSIEFCGGTHLRHTGEAGFFKIISEESVSKGVRRITAVTGRGAVEYVQSMELGMRQISHAMSAPIDQVPKRVASLQEEIRQLKKKLASGAGGAFDAKQVADEIVSKISGQEKFVAVEVKAMQPDQMLSVIDSVKKRTGTFGVLLGAVIDEKASFVAAVSDDLIARGLKAGDWVREAAKVAGGGGGGRPQLAQAGGKDPSKIQDALHIARTFAKNVVK
jgi:alanyl-tRNA synthetase